MPPSPSLRVSPGRESAHKRGRSLEHGLSRNNNNDINNNNNNKSRDDDLALFNAVQDRDREREGFLLQSCDDFDESLNKLRYFSETKPLNIPARGESSDLLNAEGDKNDYDWLLTPPDTPLFPSLDDEEEPPQLKLVLTRGRSQSQVKSLSRSSTIERTTQRSSRSSASPSRHSPSPRSSISSTFNSSATPTATQRAATPTAAQRATPTAARRLSTTPSQPARPATRRSASPAPRRISTPPPSKRGVSPVKSSSSPKWNPPAGASAETPANLRTASSARPRRQSMSPTPSRSASSSHSYDRFSSHSAGDDDVDSMNSGNNNNNNNVNVNSNNNSGGKRNLGMIKNRTVAVAKKPVKNVNPTVGSAPKRSFDSALWLMDHRKAPQNMFRPLLSSVPTTSFVSGKSSNIITNRPVVSRNSSLTTSSNASSDHVDQVDYFEPAKTDGSDLLHHDDMFMFDKVDEMNESEGLNEEVLEGSREVEVVCSRCEKRFWVAERDCDVDLCEGCVDILNQERVKLVILARGNNEGVCGINEECNELLQGSLERNEERLTESERINEERNEWIKPLDLESRDGSNETMVKEINRKDNFVKLPTESTRDVTALPSHFEQEPDIKPDFVTQKQNSPDSNLEIPPVQIPKTEKTEREGISVLLQSSSNIYPATENKSVESSEREGISVLSLQKSSSNKSPIIENKSVENSEREGISALLHSSNKYPLTETKSVESTEREGISVLLHSSSNKYPIIENKSTENSEGAGISVLLQSTSNKYPVVENKSLFSASNVQQVSEPYYTRDHTVLKQVSEPYYTKDHTVLKRSFGHQSSSASSSMDLGPFRNNNKEGKLKRALSNKIKTPSHKSACSVSDMSISEASVKNSNDEVLCHSFDYDINNNNDDDDDNDDEVVRIMSPLARERNNNVLEASSEEREYLKSENMSEKINETLSEKINESIDSVVIKNEAEIRRVSVHAISSPVESSSIVEISNNNNNNNHEAPAGSQRREMKRSFTLEEATDTILLCSSIVHDLAYKAASIAIDQKDDSAPHEAPAQRPNVTIVEKAPVKEDNSQKAPVKRIVNARKVKRKRPDLENNNNAKESELGENNIGDNNNNNDNNESRKPAQPPTPKLEAKCNCVIM